jgi:putative transposase
MVRQLRRDGYGVGRERVRRLMRLMGLAAIYQHPRTTVPHPGHRVHPYLLRGLPIDRPNWRLSNIMDVAFCVAAAEEALGRRRSSTPTRVASSPRRNSPAF